MSAAREGSLRRCWPDGLRWAGSLSLALGIHATAATMLLGHWRTNEEPVANGPVIVIDLAPVAAARAVPHSDAAPRNA